jgi:N-acetylneuraminic acid mutarotase
MTEPRDVNERPRRWPRRLAAVGSFLVGVGSLVTVIVLTLHVDRSPPTDVRTALLRVRLVGALDTPVQSAAGAPLATGEGIRVVGGLTQANTPVGAVQQFVPGASSASGTLPMPTRSGAAVLLGATTYLLGGVGAPAAGAAILGLSAGGGAVAKQLAVLPRPVADSAAAALDGAVFLFGGFTGQQPTATVFAWQPGGAPHPTAHLPSRLLYDAAVPVGNQVIILGGIVDGAPSRAILSFDPLAHSVTTIGQLPIPLAHAVAGVIAGEVFVVGGRVKGPGSQTRAVYRVDPDTGGASYAGALPVAVSDAAVASSDGKILVAGGINRSGQVQRAVYEISIS